METDPKSSVATRVALAPIKFYQQWISPALPASCRFYPTCSEYAVRALGEHGVVKGLGYALIRLLKCGPWHPGGVDHVPPRRHPRHEDPHHAHAQRSHSSRGHAHRKGHQHTTPQLTETHA